LLSTKEEAAFVVTTSGLAFVPGSISLWWDTSSDLAEFESFGRTNEAVKLIRDSLKDGLFG